MQRDCELKRERATELVKGVATLVSLPEVCVRVNELVDDASSSAIDIGQAIALDPGLTARLLKIANSSFYRFPSKIETVSRAVTIIGTRELRFLVLASSAVRSFGRLPTSTLDMSEFWRHSLYCAVIARLLAAQCNVLHRERLFVAGLLHDVGHLVMYSKIPDLVQVMIHRANRSGEPMYQAERDVFDIDHGTVGAELLKLWNLPVGLQETVEFHHEPQFAADFQLETSIVHIANVLAVLAERGSTCLDDGPNIHPVAWEITRLNADIIEPTLQEARGQFLEALLLFLPGVLSVNK